MTVISAGLWQSERAKWRNMLTNMPDKFLVLVKLFAEHLSFAFQGRLRYHTSGSSNELLVSVSMRI